MDDAANREGQGPLRHPGDVIRLTAGVLVVAACAAAVHRGGVGRVEANVFRLVNELPPVLIGPLWVLMQGGAVIAVFLVGGVALVARRRLLSRDLLASGIVAWLAAKAVKALVGRARPGALLPGIVLRGAPASGVGFPSGHAAVAAALVAAAAPYLSRRIRRIAWCAVALVAVARTYVGAHLPLDVLGGAALGWAVGAGVHLLWGAPGGHPTLADVRRSLKDVGIEPGPVRLVAADARGSTPFLASDLNGRPLFVKVVGRQQRDADWLFRAWRYVAFREAGDEPPFATPKQLVEHEAYLSLLAARAGVRTPALVAAGALPDGSGLLVWGRVSGDRLGRGEQPITDTFLDDLWQQVRRLHAAGIAHRDLRRANIVVNDADQPWIVDFGFSEATAGDRLLAQDVAELLASLASVVGSERALHSARRVLPGEALAPALPLLQPLALSAATRRELRAHPGLLAELRHKLARSLGCETDPPLEPLPRVGPRTVVALLVGVVAVHLLIPQVAELRQTLDALKRARWDWLVPAALASGFTYLMATVALLAASGRPLPFGRTLLAQLAASVANRLAPGGAGGAGANVRYLERSGVARAEAIAAVTLTSATGFVVHALALAATAALVAGSGVEAVKLPHRWPLLILIVTLGAVAGIVFWSPLGRRRLLPPLSDAVRSLVSALRRPRQAAMVFGASSGVTAGYIIALSFSLRAFGAHPSLLRVAAAYLAGAAVASASPTPGGLGAVEAALVAGLTRLNVAAGPAIAGVLSFRLLTYWAPVVPGLIAVRWLRRHRAL